MKVQVLRGRSGKWFWRLVAENGKTLAHSESYSSRSKCSKTAESVAGELNNCKKIELEVILEK